MGSRSQHLATRRTQEHETTLTLLRRRAIATEGRDRDPHRQVVAKPTQQVGAASDDIALRTGFEICALSTLQPRPSPHDLAFPRLPPNTAMTPANLVATMVEAEQEPRRNQTDNPPHPGIAFSIARTPSRCSQSSRYFFSLASKDTVFFVQTRVCGEPFRSVVQSTSQLQLRMHASR